MLQRRRATKDEQKQARRQAMLDVAWEMFQATAYQAITMAEVADRLGLAKGTTYLYFKTKEELFLAVHEQQLSNWFRAIDAELAGLVGQASTAQVAQTISASVAERPSLTRLLAILHTLLEQNIDYATALHFKQMLLANTEQVGARLEQCLPFLGPGGGAQLLIRIHAIVIGFQHVADPSPIVREVLENPELAVFNINFATELTATLAALFAGLESESQS